MHVIELEHKFNTLCENTTGLDVVIIQDMQLGFDSTPTNIRGEARKLEKLGWKPFITIEKILGELV